MNKSILDTIQTEFIFLQYSIGHRCPLYLIKQSILHICTNIELLNPQSKDYTLYKQRLFRFIFYVRDGYFNGKQRPRESYEILLTACSFYPNEILRLIELYIYYGSFKDINNLILLTHDDPRYHAITATCYDVYVKYLLIDYYKVFYFMEHDGTSVSISKCAQYIPKENKNIDKHTGATHEITQRLFPNEYTHRPGSALKKFSHIYQTILKITNISNVAAKKSLYEPLEFNFLHSDCVQTRSFAMAYINHNAKIKLHHLVSPHYLQAYRGHILHYYNNTIRDSYTPLLDCYVSKHYDDDTLDYIKHYYYTNIDFFWSIYNTFISHTYYDSIDKIIHTS